MERRVEELLKLLHSLAFTDSDSIVNEIRQIVLSPNVSMPSMSFFSSKLLNSEVSLLQFILKNRTESDRLLWKTVSNTLTLVSDYIQERGTRIAEYAVEIKDTCLQLMASSTKSSMVKEAALGPLIRLLEVFSPAKLKEILDPRKLFEILLDHKLRYEERTLGSTLKGSIFNMLGLLVNSFQEELEDRALELQKIMLVRIKEQLYKGSKTEEKTVAGILKGFAHALKVFKYEEHDLKEIFNYVKALLTPIQSGRYTVLKASLKVLCENSGLFKPMIHSYSQEVLRELFNLIKSNNSTVKFLAQETTENVLAVLAEVVVDLQDFTCFEYTLKMLTSQIASKSPEVIQNTIKNIGVFSHAIATLKSEDYLKTLLSTIIDLSKESINSENEPEDFKGMLLRQKRLNSLLTAYSDIARSLKSVPEPALLHFSEVSVDIFQKNYTWHKKYRSKLYNSLAQLFASLYMHRETFTQWIRVFIVKAMKQLLVFDDSTSRIEAAGKLWLGVLQQECLTENALIVLTDEIMRFFYQLLLKLDLNYATYEGNLNPSNPEDQQVLFQASEFLTILWPQICKRTDSWIMLFFTAVSRKIEELPLLPSLYNMARITLKVCDLNSYCDSDLQFKVLILAMIKGVINTMQNYQDALLSSCIELCLSVPICVVYSPSFNNLSLFLPVVTQALSLSLSYLPLAHSVINTLNAWRKKIPMSSLKSILPTVLPALSPFLTLDKISQEIAGQEELIKSRQKKRTVAFRIFKFIGSLGGESHSMIDEKFSQCSFFDFQNNLQMTIRLNSHSLELNFDQVLARVLHLAEKSNDSKTKIASCELLHALVLFTIGKRTESEVQFDKLYNHVFPVVYRLAIDLDPVARQLFEPLTRQLVRWFGKKFPFDSSETQSLLSALEASVCSASSALRNLASDCFGEFCKYSVQNTQDPRPAFKQTLKRIQSFSTHPQVEKRRAAVQCFAKLLHPMSQNDHLLSRFLLEFTHEMFVACKLAHHDKNPEILKTCRDTLNDLRQLLQAKVQLFLPTCDERSFHKNIFEFIEWLWDFCKRPERLARETAQEFWKDLVVASRFDVKKWKTRKNFRREVQDEGSDPAFIEGLIEFYLWVSECGLFSWKGDELGSRISGFLNSDKKNLSCQDCIRTFLAVLKHNQYFPIKEVDQQLLLEILVAPQNLGIYSNVETTEVNLLYAEVSAKAVEVLKNIGIDGKTILKTWESVDLEHERNLKLALQGIQHLIQSQDSLKQELSLFFTQVLEKNMLDQFLKQSNPRHGKVFLDFLIKVQISKDCLRVLLKTSSVMSQYSDLIFEFILQSMFPHLETLFLTFADKPDQLLVLLVPVLEKGKLLIEQKLVDLRQFIKCFLKQAVPLFSALALVPSAELSLGVVRTYCIFLEYSKDLSIFNEGVQEIVSNGFYPHVLQLLQKFLASGQNFSVQKEALRLLVASWEVFGDQVMKEVRTELLEIQSSCFFQSSQNFSASKQANESEMMVRSFLEMFLRVRTFECLELLFALVREQKSSFLAELKHVINEFIKFQVTQNPRETFERLLKVFSDPDSDKGLGDNLRWGVATKVILPFIDFVDEVLAEDFMIIACKDLISRLNAVKFSQMLEAKDYLILLREKTFILFIVEKFLAKVPSLRFKENVHKAIFGTAAQGNELTKQLITFCDKYRKDRPENCEIIENLANASEYIREFLQSSYSCLLTCIRKTQSQEKVFFNFLFKDTNWKNLIEDKDDLNFKPQTPYFQKDLTRAASEKISTLYISSSLFSQELAVLRPDKIDFSDPGEASKQGQELDLEPDVLNSLPMMKPLLDVIDKMETLFTSVEMPQWMQCLHSCLADSSCFTSIKLFIIKVILNRPKSFEKWAGLWLAPVCAVMSGKNGGKGFHYFLRDTCTLLLYDWPDLPTKGKEKECGRFLNYLIKVVADTNEKIFKSNLQLIRGLLLKWRTPVEHSYLEGMMKKNVADDDNKTAVIWKVAGLVVFGYCVEANVRVLNDGRENLDVLDECLVKCLDVNRRAVVTAAAEVLGQRLSLAPALTQVLLDVLKKKEVKDVGAYVNILQKITQSFPQILDQKQVSGRVNALLASLSGNIRAGLLQAIFHYSQYLASQNSLNNLPDICEYINREKERITNDNEDSHRLALLNLIQSLQHFIENPSVKRLISSVLLQLSPFAGASSSEIRKALYEVMQQAYRLSSLLENPVAVRSKSREILLKGLTDSVHSDSILAFWNSPERLSQDPQTRMFQCLSELYTAECEELWLVVSSNLLVRLCELSPEYEKFLFEQPLDNCEFTQLNVNLLGKSSLPMTPMFSPSYFHQEGIKKKEVSSSQGFSTRPQRIRHFEQFSQASLEERREKAAKMQMERVEQKIKEQRERRGNIVRTYRAGELPDIQIKSSDILGPLSNLILLDCEIASHIWVSLCPKLFSRLELESRKKIIQAITRILEISQNCNPDVISCMHRTLRELVSQSGDFARSLNAKHIYSSGVKSMCYQSAIMLLQECLLKYDPGPFNAHSGNEESEVTAETNDFWVYLTKVYEKMGDLDSVKGLWVKIFSKTTADKLKNIQNAFESKSNGDLATAIEIYSKVLPTVSSKLRGMIKSEYEDSLAHLGKWQALKEGSLATSGMKMKSLLRLNQFAELTEVVQSLPPMSLYTRFPYEMSLLNVTQDDTDRARYYMDQDFSRFVEKWQALKPLSYLARHKLIQKAQKIHDLAEFLSIKEPKRGESPEEYLERTASVVKDWLNRLPSTALDDQATWEEVLFARVLFFDKIKATVDLEPFGLNDFASLLYAKFAEFPLKHQSFQVAEVMLKESLNRRADPSRVDFTILSPVLKLKAKVLSLYSGESETPEIINYFKKLKKRLEANSDLETENSSLLFAQLQKYFIKALGDREDCRENLKKSTNLAYDKLFKVRETFPLKFCRFCDSILRKFEEKPDRFDELLNEIKLNPESLAQNVIISGFSAMKLNSQRAHDMFPRLISLLRYRGTEQVFEDQLRTLPEWMLIRWVSQILSIFDQPKSDVFQEIIGRLINSYPQVFFYYFKTFTSVDSFQSYCKVFKGFKSKTWQIAEGMISSLAYLQDFVDALEQLVNPEQRLRYYLDLINEGAAAAAPGEYFKYLASEMQENLLNPRSPGTYSKRFADEWEKTFASVLGAPLASLSGKSSQDLVQFVETCKGKIKESPVDKPVTPINIFSEWLSDYSLDPYTLELIDLPWTYSGFSQPLVEKQVRVVSFDQNVLVLRSIRKPKRIGIHGSDEKLYHVMIKGGEDLRLDQRIQQVFTVMNRILQSSPECARSCLALKTFEIVPITKRLGLLEWVSNTEPLRSIIDFELDKHYKIKGIGQTHANYLRKTWLRSLAAASDDNYVQHHIVALTKDYTSVVNNFKTHEKSIPWDLIRQSLLGMGRTPESFLYFRKKFIDSLAVLSVAGYVIGLGDRHLDNFLLDRSDGSLVLIDFGVSFGQGVGLGIPELMPFRLTRQFLSVFSPEGSQGQFRHTMVNTLKALQKNQNSLLDCCEVFINEPLQDWVRVANMDKNIPLKKLAILKQKLNGGNSAHIMGQELQESRHANTVRFMQNYFSHLSQVILGNERSLRRTLPEHGLSPEQQVDVLIEHATDPNILGRTWIGWSPMV